MVQLAARRTCGQIDLPQISLELLIGIFKSDFLNEKYYVQWKRRQVIINSRMLSMFVVISPTEVSKCKLNCHSFFFFFSW